MAPRETFKTALADLRLDIEVLIPDNYPKVAATLRSLPEDIVISEWRHVLGGIKYEYHVHTGQTAAELKRIYDEGQRGGNPKLVNVYTKAELENIVQAPSAV